MSTYCSRPMVIEAWQYVGQRRKDWPAWLRTYRYERRDIQVHGLVIAVPTPSGTMQAYRMDWIVRGCHGEFYPCRPDVFAATFEPAHPPAASACPSPDDQARAAAIIEAWSEQCRFTANPSLQDLIATALAAARQDGAAASGLE